MAEAFDTLAASEELQTAGLDEKQSKAVARVINGAITGNVAMKSDIDSVRSDIENLSTTTKSNLESLENRLKLWIVSAIAIAIGLIKALDYLLPGVP